MSAGTVMLMLRRIHTYVAPLNVRTAAPWIPIGAWSVTAMVPGACTRLPTCAPATSYHRAITYHVPAVGNVVATVAVPVALSAVRAETSTGAWSPLVFDAQISTLPGATEFTPVAVTDTETGVIVYVVGAVYETAVGVTYTGIRAWSTGPVARLGLTIRTST
jgi:hypothetical protein